MKSGLGTHFAADFPRTTVVQSSPIKGLWAPTKPLRPYSIGCWADSSTQHNSSTQGNEPTTNVDSTPIGIDEDPITRRKRAEAVLFLSKGPVSLRKLASLAHLADATEARTLVRQLNELYENRGRAIRVEQIAGGYRLMTRVALAPWLTRLGHLPSAVRLSTPMMETLSVVAYRQPVSRANVESVRGVGCGELLRQLMEKDLVRIAGRSEELGRPYLYGTTKRFLQLFGLVNIDTLPPIKWQILDDEPIDADADDENTDAPHTLQLDSENHKENEHQPDHHPQSKESQVSIAIAPGLAEAAESTDAALTESQSEFAETMQGAFPQGNDSRSATSPAAIIEDEEDEFYGDLDDDEDEDYPDDDDWGDDDLDDDDDDLDDDDLDEDDLDEDDLDEDDLDEEDVDEDLDEDLDDESTDWEEVDDDDEEEEWDDESSDGDLDGDEDDEWSDDEAADDDEDWS